MPKPFTVIGGFLGAGKTTLVNHILRASTGTRYAVLVNDFGKINVDVELIESHDGQTIALSNGCICCSLANGFVNAMIGLMQTPDRFDHIIVEASGVSEPDRIMDFARIDPELTEDGILMLVDAFGILTSLEDSKLTQILMVQLQCASILLVNKFDQISKDTLVEVQNRLHSCNGDALQIVTTNSHVPLELILGTRAEISRRDLSAVHADKSFETFTLSAPVAIDRVTFERFCDSLPSCVLRGKGYVCFADGGYFWQKVGAGSTLTQAPQHSDGTSRIVLISTESVAFETIAGSEIFANCLGDRTRDLSAFGDPELRVQ